MSRYLRIFTMSLGISMITVAGGTACKSRMLDFTIMSSRNVDLAKFPTYKRHGQRVEGEDIAWMIVIIPTGIPSVRQAVENALAKVPGAVALVDGVIYNSHFFTVLLNRNGFIVEGTPLVDPAQAGAFKAPSPYSVAWTDESGRETVTYVTRTGLKRIREAIQDGDRAAVEALLRSEAL